MAMMRRRTYPPIPPRELPPARTVVVPSRGELFLRDTGGDGPVALLLHGWLVSADMNWSGAYDALARAGYRVLALDHRGHGRGLRPLEPFRLTDCSDDAAALLRHLDAGPATVVGYSMGGTIAQLMARDHADVVGGVVLSATCQHFQDPQTRKVWKWMGAVGIMIGLAPRSFYRAGFKRSGIRIDERTAWWLSELERHEARDVAEAGRELGRFDSRPWLGAVNAPAAVVLTGRDTAVAPSKQRELARALDAAVFEVALDHLDIAIATTEYNSALISAMAAVSPRRDALAA